MTRRSVLMVGRTRYTLPLDGSLARARQMTGRDDAGAHLENLP